VNRARFVAPPLPTRVVFGAGRIADVGLELDTAGLGQVLLLCTPGQRRFAEQIAADLGDRAVGVHDRARMHVPVESIEVARTIAADLGAHGCVAIGGGSSIGLAKALAREGALPYLAVATTYAGSEMTPVWGTTESGVKTTGKDERVRPRAVIYDPELTTGLPVAVSAASGLNAMAHAAEALYAPDGSPLVDLMAAEAVTALAGALPRIAADPADLDARGQALYAAWLCGMCLGATTMSLHHKLCHALGGAYDLPHAQTHAVLLPYSLDFNLPSAPAARNTLAAALADGDPSDGDPAVTLWRLNRRLDVPPSLAAIGLPRQGIEKVAELALASPYANPRPLDHDGLVDVLTAAFEGRAPGR
jgi:maleylacetate reductase